MTNLPPKVDTKASGAKVFETYILGRNPVLDLIDRVLPDTNWNPMTTRKDLRGFATAFEVHNMLNSRIANGNATAQEKKDARAVFDEAGEKMSLIGQDHTLDAMNQGVFAFLIASLGLLRRLKFEDIQPSERDALLEKLKGENEKALNYCNGLPDAKKEIMSAIITNVHQVK